MNSTSPMLAAAAASAASDAGAPVPPEGYKVIREGQASMMFSEAQNEVFYNKVQVLNRDLSILMISTFAEIRARERAERARRKEKRRAAAEAEAGAEAEAEEHFDAVDWSARVRETASTDGIRILDALAATGLRSIRYAKEIPGVKQVIVNDLDPTAVEVARRNVEFNGVDPALVTPQQGDATAVMYNSRDPLEQFDVIDLDPYGTATPFIDSAVQAVADGGLICVTCTDMAVLGGQHTDTCYGKYGSMPTRGKYLHEMALRIVLYALESSANRYGRHVVPVLSCGIDFYVRLFVRVYKSPAQVKRSSTKMSWVFQATQCSSFFLQPIGRATESGTSCVATVGLVGGAECPESGSKYRMGGPVWNQPIHDMEWVARAIGKLERRSTPFPFATHTRLHGLLTAVSEELPDAPLYYVLPELCVNLHCQSMKLNQMKAALIGAGYRVSAFHKEADAIKTDAPNDVVWDIMRCWVKMHPISKKRKEKNPDSAGMRILAKEPTLEANFVIPSSLRAKKKACRFPPNPEAHWGPKARAHGKRAAPQDESKEDGSAAAASSASEASGSGDGEPRAKQPRIDSDDR